MPRAFLPGGEGAVGPHLRSLRLRQIVSSAVRLVERVNRTGRADRLADRDRHRAIFVCCSRRSRGRSRISSPRGKTYHLFVAIPPPSGVPKMEENEGMGRWRALANRLWYCKTPRLTSAQRVRFQHLWLAADRVDRDTFASATSSREAGVARGHPVCPWFVLLDAVCRNVSCFGLRSCPGYGRAYSSRCPLPRERKRDVHGSGLKRDANSPGHHRRRPM